MEDDVELTVRHAHARIDGDTATLAIFTDRGRVTLRMHRLVLGALGGAIARALWPKAGEDVPAFAGAEPQSFPAQRESQEPASAPLRAGDGGELQDVPIQPAAPEPDVEAAGTPAGIAPQEIPAQHESQEPDEGLAGFDALWPEVEGPVAPSAGVEPNNIPTQPEWQDREGEGAAFTGAAPHDIPIQPEADAPAGELASLAGAEPPDDATRAEQPARRKASGPTPRRRRR